MQPAGCQAAAVRDDKAGQRAGSPIFPEGALAGRWLKAAPGRRWGRDAGLCFKFIKEALLHHRDHALLVDKADVLDAFSLPRRGLIVNAEGGRGKAAPLGEPAAQRRGFSSLARFSPELENK